MNKSGWVLSAFLFLPNVLWLLWPAPESTLPSALPRWVAVLEPMEMAMQARLLKTVVSNSTFDRGSLSPSYIKPFDVFANGGKTGNWLSALDDFRNWLIREAA